MGGAGYTIKILDIIISYSNVYGPQDHPYDCFPLSRMYTGRWRSLGSIAIKMFSLENLKEIANETTMYLVY